VRELFGETADHPGHETLALEIADEDDHVHLFVQTDSKHSPTDIARQFKPHSVSSCWSGIVRFGRSYFWGGGFWTVW